MSQNSDTKIWYNMSSVEQDVVVSSRVRLARNLASFPFPSNFKNDDSDRVMSLVFDSFSRFDNPDDYQRMTLNNLDDLGSKILAERGLFDGKSGTGIVTSTDGISSVLINSKDHVRISSFASGLKPETAFNNCCLIDSKLQKTVQFAASRDFGYLTSSVFDAGSGMKSSIRVHLPSLSFGKERKEVIKEIQNRGFVVSDCYGVGSIFDSSLGAYYQISTVSSFDGNEIDQLASITSIAKYICEIERKKREFYADNKPTVVHDIVVKAYSLAKFSMLINLRDAIDIISCIKWGVDLGFIAGIDDCSLNSLLYRIQSGHVGYLLKESDIDFEQDIENSPELKEDRLRAIILKSAVEQIAFVS